MKRLSLKYKTRSEKTVRVLCILQLCFAFTALCWHMGFPFLGEAYTVKKQLALYAFLKEEANGDRYEQLSSFEKQKLAEGTSLLNAQANRGFWKKIADSAVALTQVSILKICWIIFGIVLPILALKETKGIHQAIWLLPLLVGAFAFENIFWPSAGAEDPDEKIFPQEQELFIHYGMKRYPQKIAEERTLLENSWRDYLAKEWGNGSPEEGLFRFTLARIWAWQEQPLLGNARNSKEQVSLLALYLLWSCWIAWVIAKLLNIKETDERVS